MFKHDPEPSVYGSYHYRVPTTSSHTNKDVIANNHHNVETSRMVLNLPAFKSTAVYMTYSTTNNCYDSIENGHFEHDYVNGNFVPPEDEILAFEKVHPLANNKLVCNASSKVSVKIFFCVARRDQTREGLSPTFYWSVGWLVLYVVNSIAASRVLKPIVGFVYVVLWLPRGGIRKQTITVNFKETKLV